MKRYPDLTNARRRIARLENCLLAVLDWAAERDVELTSHGADNDDCDEYRDLMRLRQRVRRTLRAESSKGSLSRKEPHETP